MSEYQIAARHVMHNNLESPPLTEVMRALRQMGARNIRKEDNTVYWELNQYVFEDQDRFVLAQEDSVDELDLNFEVVEPPATHRVNFAYWVVDGDAAIDAWSETAPIPDLRDSLSMHEDLCDFFTFDEDFVPRYDLGKRNEPSADDAVPRDILAKIPDARIQSRSVGDGERDAVMVRVNDIDLEVNEIGTILSGTETETEELEAAIQKLLDEINTPNDATVYGAS